MSYIGVTGFTTPEQVRTALSFVPENAKRKLMVGVLASWKSLRNQPLEGFWAKRFPKADDIKNIFQADSRALNLVHYALGRASETDLCDDLVKIHSTCGAVMHGFQLNIAWPDPQRISDYRKEIVSKYNLTPYIVLQINSRSMGMCGGNMEEVFIRLQGFVSCIDGVLFDMSGGRGKQIDVLRAWEFVGMVRQGLPLQISVAGGLAANNLNELRGLLEEFPGVGIDAEGNLRTEENELDLDKVRDYLQEAYHKLERR